ncbi:MAG: DUF1275 domain-containing protein [Holophagales bacterium]|jgi:uncharacterized membrane protein YoaK (UPF0700 family)|nr:DUF1275 domain-containing protein [Holophagales bacterium]
MQNKWDISDSLWLAMLLSLSGGLMDSYSYLERGGVFANAQTGNILLFSVNLTTDNFTAAIHYIFPVIAFAVGIALASILQFRYENLPHVRWRQIVVLVEALLFFYVAFIPQSLNLLANSLISLACGAQVESFRKIRNTGVEMPIATTMCIGNLRSGVHAMLEYRLTKDKIAFKKGLFYFAVIAGFAFGAICGNFLIGFGGEKAILASGLVMLIAFSVMNSK